MKRQPYSEVSAILDTAGPSSGPGRNLSSNMAEEAAPVKSSPQKSLRRRRKELRHRAQSLVEGATDPWEEVEEYETVIPEGSEDEFVDEETAEIAEEVIEFTYTIRELGAEMILGKEYFP